MPEKRARTCLILNLVPTNKKFEIFTNFHKDNTTGLLHIFKKKKKNVEQHTFEFSDDSSKDRSL